MQRLKNFFSRFTPMQLLIGSLLVVLIGAAILRFATPQRRSTEALLLPVIPTTERAVPKKASIVQRFSPIEVPNTFSIQQYRVEEIDRLTLTQRLETEQQVSENSFKSEDDEKSLTFEPDGKVLYTFTPKEHFDVAAFAVLSVQDSHQRAQQFLELVFGSTTLTALSDKVQLYQSTQLHLDPVESIAEANLVSIPYSHKIEAYEAKFSATGEYPAKMYVDTVGRVRKAEFYPVVFTATTTQVIESLSPKESLDSVQISSVLSFFRENDSKIPLDSITQITARSVQIEYQLDPKTGYAFPWYVVTGEATSEKDKASISFVVPAVNLSVAQDR